MPPGCAISIRVENIPYTSTEYYNVPTPHPQGHVENVLVNVPSESSLQNVHAALVKIYPMNPLGPHSLTVTKNCMNL